MTNQPTGFIGKSASAICQYILNLEKELRLRGVNLSRPSFVSETLRLNTVRETISGSNEEKSILETLSETAIKSILNR